MKIHSGQTSESKTSTCQTGGIIMHLGRFIQNEWGHSQGLGHRRQGPTSIAKQGAGHSKQKRPRQKANKKVSSRGGAQHARFWAQNEFQMPCTGRNGAPILYSDPLLFDHGFADGRCLVGLKQLGRSSCKGPSVRRFLSSSGRQSHRLRLLVTDYFFQRILDFAVRPTCHELLTAAHWVLFGFVVNRME